MELVTHNAVVTAPALSHAMLTQAFFIRNGIVLENEFEAGCVFSDQMCQVNALQFNFIAIPGGIMQLTPKPEIEREGALIADKFGRIVAGLGQLPFPAMGLNFFWQEGADEQSVNVLSRRLFFREGVVPFTYFADPNARFGGYMSKEFHGMRLKLDIKPILVPRVNEVPLHRLHFAFNFHKDLDADNQAESIQQTLALWDVAKEQSRTIVEDSARGN